MEKGEPVSNDWIKTGFKPGQTGSLNIGDLNHRGEGVGKVSGFTLFIPGALPGESVEASISRVYKNYAEADLLTVNSSSPHRVEPPCPYYYDCGGCQLQHLDYDQQLAWKHNMVIETIRRIAGAEPAIPAPLGMANAWRYRNKARIHLGMENGRVTAGFYEKQSNRIIDLADCLVQHPINARTINAIRSAVQQYVDLDSSAGIGNLPISGATIRTSFATTECLVLLESRAAGAESKPERLKKLAGLINTETEHGTSGIVLLRADKKSTRSYVLSGHPYIEEKIARHRFRISPLSFFQVNSLQAGVLYEQAASLAGRPQNAYDLYCGTGNFSLYLSSETEKVIGVDSSEAAIADARVNADLNNAGNIEFINARTEEIPELLLQGKHPKTIFLNPPRKGCSKLLLDAVVKAGPNRIVYISCNPATLARDIKHLSQNNFAAALIQPVDMFPHTSHVESVCLMSKI